MLNNRTVKNFLFIVYFSIAVIIRFLLVLVNRQANDNHIEVIQRMGAGLPVGKENCWECFQPKLYHYVCLLALHIFSAGSIRVITQICQSISMCSGIIAILIAGLFILQYSKSSIIQLVAFIMLAFNPSLLGINVQATNDSFIILFGITSIYCLWKFYLEEKWYYAVFMIASVALAVLSKGSGLVIFMAIVLTLLLRIVSNKSLLYIRVLLILILTILVVLVTFSPYVSYYQKYGTPFVTNINTSPAPSFFTNTYVGRPGITSVWSGYFTFHLVELIQYPYITNGVLPFPNHRTSLWTQLFARANSLHFEQSPPSWISTDPIILFITRAIFILALIPCLIILLGFLLNVTKSIKEITQKKLRFFSQTQDWIFIIFFLSFILFIILYSYLYRDFSVMKAIFIYPAMLCFIKFFIDGSNLLFKTIAKRTFEKTVYVSIHCILVTFYILDALFLWIQLKG